ncbi:MAG: hypothetical protein ACNS60_02785 [Candidatus Cyclobacteriaceae bacterium M2_1C_046]
MRILLFFIAILSIGACENTAEETRRFSQYFDADSLINSQIELMEDWTVQVHKIAKLEGKFDTAKYIADSSYLALELNVFRKANINKPAFDDRYKKTVEENGSEKIIKYVPAEEGDELEVKYLMLTYQNDRLQELEAEVSEDHWLYDSKRTLRLQFYLNEVTPYISSYYLEGTQKMIFRDRVNFYVQGDIKPELITSVN